MNTNKIDTPTLILIIIMMMALINGLMSCSTSTRITYQVEGKWTPGPTKSSVTGWTYTNERGMAQH